jgi:hypothetical protein
MPSPAGLRRRRWSLAKAAASTSISIAGRASSTAASRAGIRRACSNIAGRRRTRTAIRSSGGGTRLVLTHRLDAGGDLADFASGWHWHLDALDRALEGETVPYDAQRWRMLRKVYEMTLPAGPALADA